MKWFPRLVLFHAGCNDGFGAACAVRHCLDPDFQPRGYVPVSYGEEPDATLLRGQDVLMVDVTYKAHQLAALADVVGSMVILDHHKTAQEDLAAYTVPELERLDSGNVWGALEARIKAGKPPIVADFNMNCSGTRLAWDFFRFGSDQRFKSLPLLFQYIEDRDLWRNELGGCHEVAAALDSYPKHYETWMELNERVGTLQGEGAHIRRARLAMIEELRPAVVHVEIGGFTVPVLNMPYTLASDTGHALLNAFPEADFAATWMNRGEYDVWSLRSEDGRADVAQVARFMGGGGHRNASGFRAIAGGAAKGVVTAPRLELA